MNRVALAVMVVLLLALAIPLALMENPEHTEAHQELARAVLVPTEKERRVIVPRCIESKPEATQTATGRALVMDPQPGRPKVGLAGPC